jgi:hypothetical protein
MSDLPRAFINMENCDHPAACFTEIRICCHCQIAALAALDAEREGRAKQISLSEVKISNLRSEYVGEITFLNLCILGLEKRLRNEKEEGR